MPLWGSFLQVGTWNIFSPDETPRWNQMWQTFETPSRHLLDILKYFISDNWAEISISQVRRLGGWVGGWCFLHNTASPRLHISSWIFKDFHSSGKSKMEPSVAIVYFHAMKDWNHILFVYNLCTWWQFSNNRYWRCPRLLLASRDAFKFNSAFLLAAGLQVTGEHSSLLWTTFCKDIR